MRFWRARPLKTEARPPVLEIFWVFSPAWDGFSWVGACTMLLFLSFGRDVVYLELAWEKRSRLFEPDGALLLVLIYFISFVFDASICWVAGAPLVLSFLDEVEICLSMLSPSVPLFLLTFSLTAPPSGGDRVFISPKIGGLSTVVDGYFWPLFGHPIIPEKVFGCCDVWSFWVSACWDFNYRMCWSAIWEKFAVPCSLRT